MNSRLLRWCCAACFCVLGAIGCWPSANCDEFESVEVPDFTILSWNIGNHLFKPVGYELRASDAVYAEHLANKIAELSPDIVVLQEVLSQAYCDAIQETSPALSCYGTSEENPPIRNLLGSDYSIVCDQRRQVECIGIHKRFGKIKGLDLGGLNLKGAETLPLPGSPCEYLEGECDGRSNKCDAESSISSILVETQAVKHLEKLRVIHAHPTAIGNVCRQRQEIQAFNLAGNEPALVVGDWNFDPDVQADIVESAIWSEFVGPGKRFQNHHPRDQETCRLKRTSVGQNKALDRLVSDFAEGVCEVFSKPRLDHGILNDSRPVEEIRGRADHYAVYCKLKIQKEET